MKGFVSPAKLDTSNIGGWPIYYKIPMWVLLVVAMFALAKSALFKEREDSIAANEAKIASLEKSFADIFQKTVDLQQYQVRANELWNILEGLLKYLPESDQAPELIKEVNQSALNSSIAITKFSPAAEVKSESYTINPFILVTKTRFENFATFAEALTKLDRIMNIVNFDLNVAPQEDQNFIDEKNMIDVSAQLQTYVYDSEMIEGLRKEVMQSTKNMKKNVK
ncbi:type 4a pilus biogenesis protein PilO [Dichelobacter nodosus]|uniref:Type IV fimbrial biogenesis protein PilO n=1 Tax=Dichelobacter nodosus (strain VCS1703A) TaxID=246195 RepID=A5EW42_DICNV|nr:type 4a pilus biogenesis protein PilO [Dichelobacter nodosus]ABQ13362.1 type IV fimbrial biogenesis protein PilO [Dichelobacter nodosus VCS1703A]KNZ39362.1 hypothetical protein AKG33_04475 [Dichelobacter nodosus]TGA65460.1 hypothetical protein E5E99_03290 [Dichelobacter nodosus]